MSKRTRSLLLLSLSMAGCFAHGQAPPDWFLNCVDPKNKTPLSNPYDINSIYNQLMLCSVGNVGTFTAGGPSTDPGPCYDPNAAAVNNMGRFCMSFGRWDDPATDPKNHGSVQQYSPNFHSGNMALNWGAPFTPGYCYANLLIDGTETFYGSAQNLFFSGFSNRYMFINDIEGDLSTRLQVELVADAVRFRWQVTNNGTVAHKVGLWFGSGANMLVDQVNYPGNHGVNGKTWAGFAEDATNVLFTNYYGSNEFKPAYVYVPTTRPPDTDTIYNRDINATLYPDYVDFVFGQTDAFGMRILNGPTAATKDIATNNPTQSNEMDIGKGFFLLGHLSAGPIAMPDQMIFDTVFLDVPAFVQKFPAVTVPPKGTQQFLNYMVSSWGNGNYALPYGVVVDAPHIVQTSDADATQLNPNPSHIRIWVDNVGGFAFDQHEFTLNDVTITMTFKKPGFTFTDVTGTIPQSNVVRINALAPRADDFRDFYVLADANVEGDIPYVVTIDSEPGDVHKEIDGDIVVASRPRTTLQPGANMISAPFNFVDTSWQAILSNFQADSGNEVQTFTWNAQRQEYENSLSAEQGKGAWAVFQNPQPVTDNYGGGPTPPSTQQTPSIQCYPGWNLIANPFNYPFPIVQINGVLAGDPTNVHTFQELVSLGYVSPYVATWDAVAKTYTYIDATSGVLEPNKAYWLNVLVESNLTIAYPPLFVEGVPNAARKMNTSVSSKLATGWQLQLAARHEFGTADSQNYVGSVASQSQANRLNMFKAPMAPKQPVQLGIIQTYNNKPKLMTRAYSAPQNSYQWTVAVDVVKPGNVTLSWPNISTLPKTLSIVLKDQTSGAQADLRANAAYSFSALTPGRRLFTLSVQKLAPIVDGLSVVQRPSTAYATYSVNYSLEAAATTTTSIFDASGQLIRVLHSNRADNAGSYADFWDRRNSAGMLVGAGMYVAQVSASTSDGRADSKSLQFPVR